MKIIFYFYFEMVVDAINGFLYMMHKAQIASSKRYACQCYVNQRNERRQPATTTQPYQYQQTSPKHTRYADGIHSAAKLVLMKG